MLHRRCIAIALVAVVAVACSGSPTEPSPTYPQVAGTYSGPVIGRALGVEANAGTMTATVAQSGNQVTINASVAGPISRTLPTLTGTINETGLFTATAGGGSRGPFNDPDCGQIQITSATLAFVGSTMTIVEDATSEFCGQISLEATLTRQ